MATVHEVLTHGQARHRAGQLDLAARIYRKILDFDPAQPDALHLLGLIEFQLNRHAAALTLFERAVAAQPDRADFHMATGKVNVALTRIDVALSALARAVALAPDNFEAAFELGVARYLRLDLAGAEVALRRALALAPDRCDARVYLGLTLGQAGRALDAIEALQNALATVDLSDRSQRPLGLMGLINLGQTLNSVGEATRATDLFARALAFAPDSADVLNNLGVIALNRGNADGAAAWFAGVVALDPSAVTAHSSLLMALASSDVSDLVLYQEARHWERLHAARCYAFIQPHGNRPDPERRLKIGYLSSDLRLGPIAYNIEGLLAGHDRAKFELICYTTYAGRDEVTARMKGLVDGWVDLSGLSDQTAAARIRADGIDILVGIAGHTAGNRPLILAHKPAPVQVSFAELTTTGMEVVDYWLTDGVIRTADQTGELFAERLYEVPSLMLHRPIAEAPPVAPPPSMSAPHVTFGSFNKPLKLSPTTLALWGRALAAVPGSRLLLKFFSAMSDREARRDVILKLGAAGISAAQVDFHDEMQPRQQHLSLYERVDVILDPTPFNGCTATFEALWMGRPVVTLAGTRFLGRMGASFLTSAGLPELVARSPDEYVAIAVALATDRERLQELSVSLRERVARSRLCDGPAYVRSIQGAYRNMWRTWCARP
ncbi:MAG: tetratricopeptide repeat protein [Alphaproteobacteria bacterium]|nr:tetratricopeptide repeat protein [Alphaproteobacteria bacterium]